MGDPAEDVIVFGARWRKKKSGEREPRTAAALALAVIPNLRSPLAIFRTAARGNEIQGYSICTVM